VEVAVAWEKRSVSECLQLAFWADQREPGPKQNQTKQNKT